MIILTSKNITKILRDLKESDFLYESFIINNRCYAVTGNDALKWSRHHPHSPFMKYQVIQKPMNPAYGNILDHLPDGFDPEIANVDSIDELRKELHNLFAIDSLLFS